MLFRSCAKLLMISMVVIVGTMACTDDEVVDPVQPGAPIDPIPSDIPPSSSASEFVPETVYFDYDSYSLTSETKAKLNVLSDHLKSNGGDVIQVEGHCDARGSVEYNIALGQKRAESVRRYLTDTGVDPSRVSTISFGEEKPAFEGEGESAWSQNRRSEFVLTQP